MPRKPPAFAIKTQVADTDAVTFTFVAQKTMYGGKHIAAGDRIFLFASENEGGCGLFAGAIVKHSTAVPRTAAARQTPRVTITVERTARATRPLGRTELWPHRGQASALPEAELAFKLYRQATNKIVGLSDAAAAFLDRCC